MATGRWRTVGTPPDTALAAGLPGDVEIGGSVLEVSGKIFFRASDPAHLFLGGDETARCA